MAQGLAHKTPINRGSTLFPGGGAPTYPFKVTYGGVKLTVAEGLFNGAAVAESVLTVSSSGTVTISATGEVGIAGTGIIVASFIVEGTGAAAKVTSVTQKLFSDVAYQLYGGVDGGNDFTQIIRGASFMDDTAGRGYAASLRGFEVVDEGAGGGSALVSPKRIQLTSSAGKSATLDVGDLTKDMTLQELTVVVSGSASDGTVTLTKRKVLALISTPEAEADDSFEAGGGVYTAGSAISIDAENAINVLMDGIIQTSDQTSTSAIAVDFLSVGEGDVRILLDLKPGTTAGDLLQWDGTGWVPLSLGVAPGILFWDGDGTLVAYPAETAGVIASNGTDWETIPFGPEEWTVYDGGVVTTRKFLTDNPDPVV